MRLELRGLLLDLVPDFAVEEHEGGEALLGHGCVAVRVGGVRRCFARSLAGRFLAPGVAFAACSRSPPLDVRVMLQYTQSGVRRGGQRASGAFFVCRLSEASGM